MKPSSGDSASQLQELASRSLREHVRNNQRFADLLRRISRGELSMQEVRDELRQFSEHETAEYLRTVTAMGINFFAGLLELNQSLNDRFFERLGQGIQGPQTATPKSQGQLVLSGNLGETVHGRFVVENRREQVSEVAMTISRVTGHDGPAFQAPFVIEPATFRLGPGEERAVRLSVHLHPELFRLHELYSCQLQVRGLQDMILDVRIQVVEERVRGESASTVESVFAESLVVEEKAPEQQTSEPAPSTSSRAANRNANTAQTTAAARGKATGKAPRNKKSSSARKRAPKQKSSS